jgi:hypothetical protein
MEDAPVAMVGNTSGRPIHRLHTREIASSGEPDLFQFVDPLDLREDSIDAFLIIMVELERFVNFHGSDYGSRKNRREGKRIIIKKMPK